MSNPPGSREAKQETLERALALARRTRAILERQSAAYTSLTIPAHLLVELREQRERITELETIYLSETSESSAAQLSGSGAAAQDRSVAASGGGVAIGRDVTGIVAGYKHDLDETRARGDRRLEGKLLSQLGAIYAGSDDIPLAIKHYEQALAIAHELSDREAEVTRLQNLGLALLRLADAEPEQRQSHLSLAAESLSQAVELFDALSAPHLQRARARYHLGRSYHRLGRWREAIALLEQARETFSRRKARPELAHALLELGQLYHQYQDFESAYLYLKDALRLFRRLEDADGIAVTQEALGNLALQTARPAEALASLQEARQGYVALKRRKRIRAVDELLRLARQSHQIAARKGVTL
jgi:tetratricopeptide (TPR) repeat protein